MGSGDIRLVAMLDVVPGKRDEFLELAEAAAATVAAEEPGTLTYDWYVSDDGTSARVYEVYESSAALLAHLGGRATTEVLKPMGPLLTGMIVEVYGEPSAELVAATEGAPFTYFDGAVAAVDR